MESSSFTLPFLLVQLGNYTLALLCLRHAWRESRYLFFVIVSAMLYGYLLEYLAVTITPQQYYYNYFLIKLPGPVPLGIALGWGVIYYAVFVTANRLTTRWWLRAVLCCLLAVGIDLVMDPVAVALNFWTWIEPYAGQWFGIPWANYIGWALTISSLSFMQQLGYRWFPPGSKGIWCDLGVAFIAIFPSFLVDKGVMTAYQWVVTLNPDRKYETLVVAAFFSFFLIIALRYILEFKRDNAVKPVILAVPLYFYFWILVSFFATELYVKFHELVIVVPAIIALNFIAFFWHCMDRMLPVAFSKQTEPIK